MEDQNISQSPINPIENKPEIKSSSFPKWPIIIIILLIILILSAGTYLLVKTSNSSAPKPTPTPSATAISPTPTDEATNWKTYKNDKYGFEIKYPRDWEESEDYYGILFSELKPIPQHGVSWGGSFRISISSNSGQLGLEEWIKGYKQEAASGANLIRGIADTILDGKPAKKVSVFAFDGTDIQTITIYNDNVYTLWFENTSNDPNMSQHLQIYNQMLSTFKFTNQNPITPAGTDDRSCDAITAVQCPTGYRCQNDGNSSAGIKCIKQ